MLLPAPPNNHCKGAITYQATKTRNGFHFSVCAPAFRTCSSRILQFSNPPGRVKGAPEFAKTKKRESYFQEFCSVTETFQENRVKAHRLSDEAAAFALQVSSISVRVTAVPPFSHAFSFRTKHLVEQVTSSISSLYLSYRDLALLQCLARYPNVDRAGARGVQGRRMSPFPSHPHGVKTSMTSSHTMLPRAPPHDCHGCHDCQQCFRTPGFEHACAAEPLGVCTGYAAVAGPHLPLERRPWCQRQRQP